LEEGGEEKERKEVTYRKEEGREEVREEIEGRNLKV
jgi:hypothetical protein